MQLPIGNKKTLAWGQGLKSLLDID